MAIVEVDAWWVYSVGSIEIGAYETEAQATMIAQASTFPNFPVVVIPGKMYKHVEDE